MYVAPQFSVFMVNKPGVLARVLGEFARAKINIIAMTMMDSVEHGVMRVVFAAPKEAREVLTKLNMPYNETEVLCVTLQNRTGALATLNSDTRTLIISSDNGSPYSASSARTLAARRISLSDRGSGIRKKCPCRD